MNCCTQVNGLEQMFGVRTAERELRRYKKKGPRKTTRIMLDALTDRVTAKGKSVLDVGGGSGSVQFELAAAGARSITNVDAASAYQEVVRDEAERRTIEKRFNFRYGDFADIARDLEASDIVTLDRVICCYENVDKLVTNAGSKAGSALAAVYPRGTWWNRVIFYCTNLALRLYRRQFRTFLHDPQRVQELLEGLGLTRVYLCKRFIWQVEVYLRPA